MIERRRGRAWVLFFAALLALAVGAVGLEVWFSLHQQLNPGALEAARTLWHRRGPADYDLRYTVARQSRSGDRLRAVLRGRAVAEVEANGDPLPPGLYSFHDLGPLFAEAEQSHGDTEVSTTAPDRSTVVYRVEVRGGRAVRAWGDDRPLPSEVASAYDMEALFAGVGEWLEHDRQAGTWRPYAVAVFDRGDGHLLHYVRSLMRTRERVEFNLVELQAVPSAADQAPSSQ